MRDNLRRLINSSGHVTLHKPVRLELRGRRKDRGIYVVYRCTETAVERDFGCLQPKAGRKVIAEQYPSLELVDVSDDAPSKVDCAA